MDETTTLKIVPQTVNEKNFETARVLYPGKKRGFATEYLNFQRKNRDWKELLTGNVLANCVDIMRRRKHYSPGYWPMFQTFINQRRWEEALQDAPMFVPAQAQHICACGCGSTACQVQREHRWFVDSTHYNKWQMGRK